MPADPRIRLALAVVCLGSLVAPLDTTVNTAFPVITAAFGLALRDIQWVVIPFVLAQTSMALVFGHLGDRIGHRRVFAAGLAASVIGHLAVALAPDFPLLVAGRVLQGMAVGMTVSCAPALATLLVAPADKARVLAVYAAVSSLGMALGPWVGGLLLQALGWPGVFLFRAPIALLALLLLPAVPVAAARPAGQGAGRFDWPGALGLIGVLTALALALTELTRPGAALMPALGLMAAGLAGALAWVRHESRAAHPVMRMAPFRSARFAGMQAASVIVNLACFGNLLLLPYVLTRELGLGIALAGLCLSAYPGGSVLGNSLAGRLAGRWPAGRLMRVGLMVAVAGLGLSAVVLGVAPAGRLGAMRAISSFTALITACAFSPVRMTTTPPTTSWPFTSSAPRRKSPPTSMRATSRRKIGVPSRSRRTTCSRSAALFTRPSPRTTNSIPFSSMTLPPTFRLLCPTAVITSSSDTPAAFILNDDTSICHCRTKPPTLATSATPGTLCSA